MPKVSVVVPNYNYGRFLAKRLSSILAQSFRDFELLYLDDASTDESPEVVERFRGDPRLRTLRNEVNSGHAFRQFNAGVRLAQGEYVWVAQADDWAEPDFLERTVAVLDAHPQVGLVYCQSLAADEQGRVLHSMARRTDALDSERWRHDHRNDGRDECRRFLLYKNTIPNASAVLFRRSVLLRAGLADESYVLSPDWKLYVDVLLLSDVAYLARPMNYFRHHGGTIRAASERAGLQLEEGYRLLAHLRERLELSDAELEEAGRRLARSWVRKALRWRERVPLRASLRIHRSAQSVDRHLHAHLLRALLPRASRPAWTAAAR
jgi:glycosyltransferase involved in cell wall biosynthesis